MDETLLDTFFLTVYDCLALSRSAPLSISLDLLHEDRPDVVARYLHLVCSHSPRWKNVSLRCPPILSQRLYPTLSPEPHPHLESIRIKTETWEEEQFVDHWDLTRADLRALEYAPNLRQLAITHSNFGELSLPWGHLSSIDLRIPDTSESTHGPTLADPFDIDKFVHTLRRFPNITLLRLHFDGEFSHLEFPDHWPPPNASHLKLERLTSLEIVTSNLFIESYLLVVLDTPELACFTLDSRYDLEDAIDMGILQGRLSAFLRSRRHTLRNLELKFLSFISEAVLVEAIGACRELRSLTVIDDWNVIGSLFLRSLTLRANVLRSRDSEHGTGVLEPDCSNPFLKKIAIYRDHLGIADSNIGDIYPREFYVGLVDMVKSRCYPSEQSNLDMTWDIEEHPEVVAHKSCDATHTSKLDVLTLCIDDADWMKENLPEQWAILEGCGEDGLALVTKNIDLVL